MNSYLLSIIIPTKNRQFYCLNSVKQIIECYGEQVEVVVQDNSDEPTLEEQIKQIGYQNIKYNYKPGVLSFVDNFDLAISLSSGKYLTIIGDDDGVTSLALEVTKYAEKHDICAIKPSLSFVYFWPKSGVFEQKDNGVLHIYKYSGAMSEYDPADGVKVLLEKSCQNYLDCELIKLYHGIVRRDLLESIKDKTGKYVGGLSPDIYLSVALSLVTEGKAVSLDVPVTISGICTGSGSSQSATGEHTGKLEDAPHFRGHTDYEWDYRIPRFYSVETIWGDSALAAIKDIAPEYLQYYHSETITHRCLRKYPKYKSIIIDSYFINGGKRTKLGKYYLSRILNKLLSKVKHVQQNSPQKIIRDLTNISVAAKECEMWINEQETKIMM